jgi:autotransporter translocation and assembly factor TamB
MKYKKKHPHTNVKIAVSIVLILVVLVVGLFSYINNSKVQSMIYSSINRVSSLDIESAKLKLNLFKRTFAVENLNLYSKKKNQRFMADRVSFKFRLLPLLKASFNVSNFNVTNLKIDIGRHEKEKKKKRPKIGLTNLLILKNITIENGQVNNIEVNFPEKQVKAKSAELSYIPSIWGNIELKVKILSPEYRPAGKTPITVADITIEGSTDVNNWLDVFPYVDDLSGKVVVNDLKLPQIEIKTLSASLKYSGNKIDLKQLSAIIGDNKLEATGSINGDSERYALNINIPEPVNLPSFGTPKSFMDTSGPLKGRVSINGKGLNYKTTTATANVYLNHNIVAGEPLPAELTSQINISGGSMSIIKADLKVGGFPVNVSGSFNYTNPNLNLSFSGDNIPIETVLNRFKEDDYHPTKGLAKVKGTFTGWKPNLKFHLEVDASEASYHDIIADRVTMTLDLTYTQLNLVGKIYQGENETGTVDLKMTMGAKQADGTRHKTFTLNAKITNDDLSKTMAEYGLRGTGNGTLTLSGSPKSYSGMAKVSIENGNLKGIGFTKVESNIKFITKKLTFGDISLTLSGANPTNFASPLFMDMTDYGVRFYGTPRAGLKIDTKYMSGSGQWQLTNISYASPNKPEWISTLTGTIGREGGLNLRAKGTLDTSLLANLRGLVRETTGPLELGSVHIGGTTENPSLSGTLTLRDNTVQLRGWGYYVDKINGTIKLSGHTISFPELKGRIEYGDFSLEGSLNHEKMEISGAKLTFDGNSIRYATKDRSFRMEFDCGLKFSGTPNSSNLTGDISILDGRYTKNFSIFDKLKKAATYKEDKVDESTWKNVHLDLKVKSNGDLKIDNNIGEIWLNTDLEIKGTSEKPRFIGSVETVDGEVRYAGLEFDVTRGFVEFRDPYTNPYIEFNAAKELGDYNIMLTVRGRVDKLYLDLQSTPPLDKKDILALLTFGVTQDEIDQARFGYQIGTGMVAEQFGALLQGPIKKFTPIDRFRVAASPRDSDITRLEFGKDVSDRMRVYLITDISSAEAIQTFQAEYAITDFLLLKGSSSTDADYRFNLTFRFREQ